MDSLNLGKVKLCNVPPPEFLNKVDLSSDLLMKLPKCEEITLEILPHSAIKSRTSLQPKPIELREISKKIIRFKKLRYKLHTRLSYFDL